MKTLPFILVIGLFFVVLVAIPIEKRFTDPNNDRDIPAFTHEELAEKGLFVDPNTGCLRRKP